MSASNVTCPKCGNSVSVVLPDTKFVLTYVLCSKCGHTIKVS